MQNSLAIGKQTADATTRANQIARESLIVTQRAYIKVSPPPNAVVFSDPPGRVIINMKVTNIGQGPATINDVILNRTVARNNERLPTNPTYTPNPEEPPEILLYKRDHFFYWMSFSIEPEDVNEIRSGTKDLCLYGYVDYIDQFGQRHRAGYARRYDPRSTKNNFVLVIEQGYNYDRHRDPGQGNDWDRPGQYPF